MSNFVTAAAMPGVIGGWLIAADLESKREPLHVPEMILTGGRYLANLTEVDCDGCAAAVEAAIQKIHGIQVVGVVPVASTIVFEVADGAAVPLSDLHQTLEEVTEALGRSIQMIGIRGPMPSKFVSQSAA